MILRGFTQNSPLLPFAYPILVIIILASGFQEWWINLESKGNLFSHLAEMNAVLIIAIVSSIITFNALLFNQIYNKSELYHTPVYLSGFIFCGYSSFAFTHSGDIQHILSQSSMLLSLYFAFSIFRQKKISHFLFLSSILMGVSSTLENIHLLFIILLLFLSFWNRPFSVKDSSIVILGFCIPALYVLCIGWSFSGNVNSILSMIEILGVKKDPGHSPMWLIIIWGIALLLSSISLSHKEDRQSNKTVQSKQYMTSLLIIGLSTSMIHFFSFGHLSIVDLTSIPVLFILSHYWTHYRTSLLSPFVFYLFTICLIIEFFHWF